MLTPMTVWLSVAVCMIALAVCRIFRTAAKGAKGFHKKFIAIASEREVIWVPGDMPVRDNDDYEDADDL